MSTFEQERHPRLLADAFRRRWVVLVAGALVGLIAGFGIKLLKTTTYDGETTVLVNPLPGNPFNQQSQSNLLVNISTEAEVVRSDEVGRLAAPLLTAEGYPNVTVAGLISRVRAVVETNTQVLRITYSARTATRARDGADAFAKAFLDFRANNAKGNASTELASIAAKRAQAEAVLTGYQQSLAQTDPSSSSAATLQDQIKTVDQTLSDLRIREADTLKRKVVAGSVLSPAALPQAPHGTSKTVLGGLGLVLGLILGIVVAVGLERSSGRIRRPDAMPGGLPVLAVVHPSGVAQPVLLTQPDHESSEPYRLLMLAVDAALPSDRAGTGLAGARPGRIVAVASLTDPAPPVAINAALAAAEAGRATTFVDALPAASSPRLPGLPTAASASGLSEVVLEGRDPVASRLYLAPQLTYLPSGQSLDRAAEAYAGPRMRSIIDRLSRGCELLMLAVPPLSNPDGQALASLADAVVLVVPLGSATERQLDEAAAEARRVHASIIGVVAAYPGRSRQAAPTPTEATTVSVRDERPPAPATRITS